MATPKKPRRLYNLMANAPERRERVREHVMDGIEEIFPLEGSRYTLRLVRFKMSPQMYGMSAQKRAVMEKTSLVEPLKAELHLVDNSTGKVVDRSTRTIAHIPYMTERHTFIAGGNEYSVANQVRIKPGVYTRVRDNGELEAAFNLGRGTNFRIEMDPERGVLFARYGSTRIALYPILEAFGVSSGQIEQAWGRELAKLNRDYGAGKRDREVKKLYEKVIPTFAQEKDLSTQEMVKAIQGAYENTELNPEVTQTTLGKGFERVDPDALLRAARKLVRVFRQEEKQDDRDSLAFKTLHTAESFFKERITKNARRDLRRKVIPKLNKPMDEPKISKILPPAPFSKPLHSFITTSSLSNQPMAINPMEIIDSAVKVTSMGEGGISSTLAVPDEARQVHGSHLGVLDPVRTPESGKVGVDIRGTLALTRDDRGNMYTMLRNVRTGKVEPVPAHKAMEARVAFHGQDITTKKRKKSRVSALYRGDVLAVNPDDVDYQVPHAAMLYSPTTNLVPMLNSAQGNRNIMGSKFQTQALPLKFREKPLVQVNSWRADKNESVEDYFGRNYIAASAPVSGTIEKIDDDFIYIRPDRKKKAAEGIVEAPVEVATVNVPVDIVVAEALPIEAELTDADIEALGDGKVPEYRRPSLVRAAAQALVGAREEGVRGALEGAKAGLNPHGTGPDVRDMLSEELLRKRQEKIGRALRETEDDGLVRVPYATNYPLATKTFMHDDLKVKKGQRVREGELLAESNFTKDGTLALGKNLRVAYLAYEGKNSNDAFVMSESAAKKMTSSHMYTETLSRNKLITLDVDKHRAYFGTNYSRDEYARLDKQGVIEPGETVHHGELVIAAMQDSPPTSRSQMLGKLHKSLVKPYRDISITWEHAHPGEVIDVSITDSVVTVTIKTEEPVKIGDKIANRYGAKGIISEIVPDDQMVKDEQGRTLDVLMTSVGISTRINPNQVIETALAKVAEKTGETIRLDQVPKENYVDFAKKLLKKHGIKDKETVYDPKTGRKISGIMVGPQYVFKPFKSADTNFAGRGIGPGYDSNMQPSKGGDMGAKSIGKMEFNTLISHNARAILRETANVKSQRNDEFWRRFQLGLPTPMPTENFAYDKFNHMLTGAGVKVEKKGTTMSLAPLTDQDIDAMASSTVKQPLLMKTKTGKGTAFIEAEDGGLFDPAATGGLQGEKFSKIELEEPVVNPVFEEPARQLLGMTKRDFRKLRDEEGAAEIKQRLNAINLDAFEREALEEARTATGSKRNTAVKRIKYVRALKDKGLRAGDAYVLSKIPVTPPVVRPILPNPDGTTLVADANYLYRDVMLADEAVRTLPKALRTKEEMRKHRSNLHDTTAALFGTQEPTNPQSKGRGVKGHLMQITGKGSPKGGYFQSRLMKRRQDLSGRATIAPGVDLGMDEVGLPEEMAWRMYAPFITKDLIKRGYTALDARKHVEDRTPAARNALLKETQKRPVLFNRAPSLHRYSMVAGFPRLIGGKTLKINPFAEEGMNADYDGDALQLHVPVTDAAVQEARRMTTSNLVFADRSKDNLMVFPAHEAIVGTYMATSKRDNVKARRFKTLAEAKAAYERNEINMSTPVTVDELQESKK